MICPVQQALRRAGSLSSQRCPRTPARGSISGMVLGRLLTPASDSYRSIRAAVPQIEIGPRGRQIDGYFPFARATAGARGAPECDPRTSGVPCPGTPGPGDSGLPESRSGRGQQWRSRTGRWCDSLPREYDRRLSDVRVHSHEGRVAACSTIGRDPSRPLGPSSSFTTLPRCPASVGRPPGPANCSTSTAMSQGTPTKGIAMSPDPLNQT